MTKRHRALLSFAAASGLAYLAWALVLKYGSAREKVWATVFAVVSPIPPVP